MTTVKECTALIFVKRPELRDLVRQGLKAHSFTTESLHTITSPREFQKALQNSASALCVLDWQLGMEALTEVLSDIRQEGKIESHPVLLLSSFEDKGLPGFAREYLISKVLMGELSLDLIKKSLAQMAKLYFEINPIKDQLIAAGKAQRDGDAMQALSILESLHEQYPESLRLHTELAEALAHLNRWQEVRQCLEALLTPELQSPRVLQLYARSLLRLGDTAGAIQMMERAKFLNPNNMERLLELGSILIQDHQVAKAAQVYKEAAQLAPQSKEAKMGQAVSHILMDEVNEVLDMMRTPTLHRELGAVFNLAGVIAARSQQYELGLKLYNQALQYIEKQHELSARVYFNKGLAFFKFERPDEAIQMFDKAITLDPSLDQAATNRRVLMAQQHKGNGLHSGSKAIELENLDDSSPLHEVRDILQEDLEGGEESELDRIIGRGA